MSGIDPYASAVSDVYQDLFGEGSYAGKGIYDVDAFEAALAGRVPDSTLLSHDLFEGVFARAGLASDIEVVEEFPARYDVGALRHHRWARGDWQLLPWILGTRTDGGCRSARAAPCRRSAAGRCSTICGARCRRRRPSSPCWPAGRCRSTHALVWTAFVLATIVLPTLIPVVGAIVPRRAGITPRSHLRALGGDLRLALTLVGAADHLSRASGVADGRRDRADPGPAVRHPPASARMGDRRRRRRSAPGSISSGFYRRMAGALVIGAAGAGRRVARRGDGTWPLAAAVRGALDRLAGDRALGEPVAARRRPAAGVGAPTRAPCG